MSRTIHFADKGVRARTAASEPGVLARLREIVGEENVLVDEERVEPYAGDALKEKFPPEAVVLPRTTEEVSAILRLANERRFPVTARGGGVGYTGGAVPVEGGVVVGTDRMNRIREVSVENLYAVTGKRRSSASRRIAETSPAVRGSTTASGGNFSFSASPA